MIKVKELKEYQNLAMRTANTKESRNDMLLNGVMGLNGESGECIDLMKKHLFQGHTFDGEHLFEELGDVLWYVALTAHALGVTLEDIATSNIAKLMKRYPDGFSEERSVNRE